MGLFDEEAGIFRPILQPHGCMDAGAVAAQGSLFSDSLLDNHDRRYSSGPRGSHRRELYRHPTDKTKDQQIAEGHSATADGGLRGRRSGKSGLSPVVACEVRSLACSASAAPPGPIRRGVSPGNPFFLLASFHCQVNNRRA